MSRRGPEGKIQDAVVKYARTEYGALVKKQEAGSYHISAGWPDVMVLGAGGKIFFIEFKAPGNALTPIQAHVARAITKLGHTTRVVRSVEEGCALVDQELGGDK